MCIRDSSECAVIAGITKNPAGYNPILHPKENAKRRKNVLDAMKKQGYISQKQYDKAMADDVYGRISEHNDVREEMCIRDRNSASSFYGSDLYTVHSSVKTVWKHDFKEGNSFCWTRAGILYCRSSEVFTA